MLSASMASAILASFLPLHSLAHSFTILATSPAYRASIARVSRIGLNSLRNVLRIPPNEGPLSKVSVVVFSGRSHTKMKSTRNLWRFSRYMLCNIEWSLSHMFTVKILSTWWKFLHDAGSWTNWSLRSLAISGNWETCKRYIWWDRFYNCFRHSRKQQKYLQFPRRPYYYLACFLCTHSLTRSRS